MEIDFQYTRTFVLFYSDLKYKFLVNLDNIGQVALTPKYDNDIRIQIFVYSLFYVQCTSKRIRPISVENST